MQDAAAGHTTKQKGIDALIKELKERQALAMARHAAKPRREVQEPWKRIEGFVVRPDVKVDLDGHSDARG